MHPVGDQYLGANELLYDIQGRRQSAFRCLVVFAILQLVLSWNTSMALTLTVIFPAFNAALVIYSGLLIKAYADSQDDVFSLGNINIDRRLLLQAVETLATLDNGNVRAEKCARYIMKLDRVLDALCMSMI